MMKKVLSLGLFVTLVCCLCGTSVFAKTGSETGTPTKAEPTSKSAPLTKSDAKAESKLKADMLKLVADAKAGKVAPRAQQFPNTHRNNLSTGAKIGIAAAIGGAIFLIIMFHQLSKD